MQVQIQNRVLKLVVPTQAGPVLLSTKAGTTNIGFQTLSTNFSRLMVEKVGWHGERVDTGW